MARSSAGLRMGTDPGGFKTLPQIVEPLSDTPIEIIEPLPLEYSDATPAVERFNEMQQWVLARRELGPIARHALYVLEMTDALDMTVDTFFSGLLHGETDTSGYPDYHAVVGGLASHFDELSGALIVRAVVGWGGKGQRGDTERNARRLLSSLYQQVRATGQTLGPAAAATRAVTGPERGGSVCSHCGFESGIDAFYCPKCGMRKGARGA